MWTLGQVTSVSRMERFHCSANISFHLKPSKTRTSAHVCAQPSVALLLENLCVLKCGEYLKVGALNLHSKCLLFALMETSHTLQNSVFNYRTKTQEQSRCLKAIWT